MLEVRHHFHTNLPSFTSGKINYFVYMLKLDHVVFSIDCFFLSLLLLKKGVVLIHAMLEFGLMIPTMLLCTYWWTWLSEWRDKARRQRHRKAARSTLQLLKSGRKHHRKTYRMTGLMSPRGMLSLHTHCLALSLSV